MSPTTSSSLAPWLAAVVLASSAVAGVASLGILREPTPAAVTHPGDASASAVLPEVQAEGEANPAETVAPSEAPVTPAYSPWAPGSTFHLTTEYPQPGVSFSATECTAAFSFDGADGRMYAVTASHCGSVGDLLWPSDGSTMADYTVELGRVIYSGLDQAPAPDDEGRVPDVAIVEIFNPGRPMVTGGEPPVDTVLANLPPEATGQACKIGGTTGITCGDLGLRGEHYIMVDPETDAEVRTVGDTAYLCAQRGDSGGPVTAGVAGHTAVVGLVSGTREDAQGSPECNGDGISAPAGAIAYASMAQIREIIAQVVPDARLLPVESA
ncbi:hypothetical protein [Corynebacterium doosanense]|uniref:Peptidase S1 domain-containing protein n=1 Tax=Corynebacterium doosanense CAU 212 = DSM 45436 TaxID=558173 RepID=A0A097IHA6_9CORY|nr:hypothetical protein [Corynebacterium doosanense]AIT61517.1 hypothetical protein CDOO_09735 [Corynebacterium doosanense CAU 212 = DSM 45436]